MRTRLRFNVGGFATAALLFPLLANTGSRVLEIATAAPGALVFYLFQLLGISCDS